ncbi:hypothetical protein RclHR1_35920001, partial [Rhizophagus clarus]
METSLTNTYCHGCKTFKALSEFMGHGANSISKQLKTCNNCRQRFTQKRKRSAVINNQPNILEVIDIDFLSEVITNLLEDTSSNNQELHLHCQVNDVNDVSYHRNSTNEYLSKELANKIIELIEDADGYKWNYNHQYISKNNITYWYYCSQRDIQASKSRKHSDPSKQRDTLSMERFDCEGIVKISIDKTTLLSEVELFHKNLHVRPIDKSVPEDVKEFIKNNIDLLPKEIYARLVDKGLNVLIRQNQIHFWWTKLGQGRYKRCEDAFDSTCLWLSENNHHIILQEIEPVRALAFETGILEQLNELKINISECGMDATYNTNNMGFELYVLHAEVNGTGFPLSY